MKWIDLPEVNIPYFTFENLSQAGFPVNACTTKRYRKNSEPCDFLQLWEGNDSDPEEVRFCTDLLLGQFGTDRDHLVPSDQKHTANIHIVTSEDLGPSEGRRALTAVDGMVTNLPGVMLQTFGADCPSVFLADPVHKAIGLCHSGRKGTQQHIAAVMLRTMEREYHTCPSETLCAVSPGICENCYEVGTDVAVDFIKDYLDPGVLAVPYDVSETAVQETIPESLIPGITASDAALLRAGRTLGLLSRVNGRYHINLAAAVTLSLKTAGIPADHMEVSQICTRCRSDLLFSLRAEGRISNENSSVFMI